MGKSTISMAMFNSYVKITRGYFSQYMEKIGKIIQMFQTTNQPGFEAAKTSDLFGKTKTSDLSQNQKIWSFNQQKSGICCSDLSECQVSSSPKKIYQHKLFFFPKCVCVWFHQQTHTENLLFRNKEGDLINKHSKNMIKNKGIDYLSIDYLSDNMVGLAGCQKLACTQATCHDLKHYLVWN